MMSGTSQAAPHIAGLAAYLMALEGISGHEVQNRIKELATPGMIVDAKVRKLPYLSFAHLHPRQPNSREGGSQLQVNERHGLRS